MDHVSYLKKISDLLLLLSPSEEYIHRTDIRIKIQNIHFVTSSVQTKLCLDIACFFHLHSVGNIREYM